MYSSASSVGIRFATTKLHYGMNNKNIKSLLDDDTNVENVIDVLWERSLFYKI